MNKTINIPKTTLRRMRLKKPNGSLKFFIKSQSYVYNNYKAFSLLNINKLPK